MSGQAHLGSPLAIARRAFAAILALLGAVLLLGGLRLIELGGSWWYALAGAALIAIAILQWRGNRLAWRAYAGFLLLTAAWSVWEAGLDVWALLPRLDLFILLAPGFLISAGRNPGAGPAPASFRSRLRIVAPMLGLGAALVLGFIALRARTASPIDHAQAIARDVPDTPADWRYYGNDADGTRYSSLRQINSADVGRLRLAWSYRTGDRARPGQNYNFEATPLEVAGLLYVCTPSGQALALDAATGREVWHFDARSDLRGIKTFTCRGVSYYDSGADARRCGARVYVATPTDELWSLDALTGLPCTDFGRSGAIDLKDGLGPVSAGTYAVTSPPLVIRGRLIVGAMVQDNVSVDMPSGVVRAFDARSGALVWAWDVGDPDHSGAPARSGHFTRSTPNAWAPLVGDAARGLVYIPTGSAASDFWGRKRRPFDEQFGASLVAVDAESGRTRWRFQTVHHDLWDNDVPSQPVLIDLPTARGPRAAVVIGTKQGNIFVLDREDGTPIVPVTEGPVPQGSNTGERLAATQPVSGLFLNPGPGRLTEQTMWGISAADQMWCRIQYRKARYEGPFTPPGNGRTLVYPGMFGGVEWGGLTVDPERKILIANPDAMPFIVRMAPMLPAANAAQTSDAKDPGKRIGSESGQAGLVAVRGTGYGVSFYAMLSPLHVPCLQPPWGKLYAVDLRTDRVLWERPVGTLQDSGPLGFATHLPITIGTPQVGGTILTAGGLIFSAGTLDQYLRAYAVETGREIWKARLPAGGQATPMTYAVNGRQYIVIAAGGHAVLGTRQGDYLLAYALDGTAAGAPGSALAANRH